MDYPAVAIIGPTASGKSALGTMLAGEFRGEVVSCDALQVYRGLDIGTAKPTPVERGAISHHMIDLREPGEDFSAGEYQRLGREVLRQIRRRGHIPFLIGGTGLYLRALLEGLFEGPGRSAELRDRMRRIVDRKGPACLYRALEKVDASSAARISPRDTARILRAYEVYLLTGRPISWWQSRPPNGLDGFRWIKIGIAWPRPILYRRIDERVDCMFNAGFVEEVDRLRRSFPAASHAFKAIGYRQILELLEGRMSLEEARESTKRESRRYAKRQLTWFGRDSGILWLDGNLGRDGLVSEARESVRRFLESDVS